MKNVGYSAARKDKLSSRFDTSGHLKGEKKHWEQFPLFVRAWLNRMNPFETRMNPVRND